MHLFCNLCLKLGKSGLFGDENRNDNDQTEKLTEQMEHARIHYRQLQIVGGSGKTMEAVFEQCFSNIEPIDKLSAKSGNEKLDRGSLTQFCHTIIKAVPDKNYLSCGECGSELKIRNPSLDFAVIIRHACSHLGKKLFLCRQCDYGTTNSNSIYQHIKRAHKFSSQKNDYVDLSKDHQDEIQAMIKRCFSGKHLCKKKLSKEEQQKISSNNRLKTHFRFNQLLKERLMLMQDLTRKYGTESRTILCRLCSKDISALDKKGIHSKGTINHALTHLDKPLFRCKRCSKTATNLKTIDAHIRCAHKVTSTAGEYEDRSGDFHKDILDILKKCYDAEVNTK